MNNYIVGNKDKTLFLGYNNDNGYYYTTDNIGETLFFPYIIGAKGLIKDVKRDDKSELKRLIRNYEYQKENWGWNVDSIAYAKKIVEECKERLELANNAVIYEVEFILKEAK